MSEYPISSLRGKIMMTYLPEYYLASRVMGSIMQTVGKEIDDLQEALTVALRQFFVNTADEWGLEIWEAELNLPPYRTESGNQINIQERRRRIISKLQGYGTTTAAVLKKVAGGYEKGQIEVIEDLPNYLVIIKFIDKAGVPANLLDIIGVLRDIIPAHLNMEFIEYDHFLWDELDKKNWTWNQLDALNLSWNFLEVYI